MLRLVGFDLDGTLLNSLPDLADAVNDALKREGLPQRTVEEVRQFIGNGVYLLIQRAAAPVTEEAVLKRLKEHFDAYYGVHYCDKSRLYDGIADLLNRLRDRGVQVVVYSNKPAEFAKGIMNQLFPSYDFAGVLGQHKDFPKKPDAGQFKQLQAKLGIADAECCYVGDSDVDVQTAKNAGVRFVGVDWGYRERSVLEEAGATCIVHTAEELAEKLIG